MAYLLKNCKSLNKYLCSNLWCITIRDNLNNSSNHSNTKGNCSSLSNLLNRANNPSASKIFRPEWTSTLNNTSRNPHLNPSTTSPPQISYWEEAPFRASFKGAKFRQLKCKFQAYNSPLSQLFKIHRASADWLLSNYLNSSHSRFNNN